MYVYICIYMYIYMCIYMYVYIFSTLLGAPHGEQDLCLADVVDVRNYIYIDTAHTYIESSRSS